ncbi:hypothetical protein [Prescottella subtropica]|uniref:hypothetical protein n=1 Tax=Prescottella subtropica TaxID=2545757 RepID=UPI0010F6E70E|nr:hypothetical protein [Prescottella subtropica]
MLTAPNTDRIPHPRNALGVLAVVEDWQRAAIVWVYTDEARGGMTVRQFADLGIKGLSRRFVVKYRDAWQEAIDRGLAAPLSIGDRIPEVALEWRHTGNAHMHDCTCGCSSRAA